MKPNPKVPETTRPDNQPDRKQAVQSVSKAPNFDTMKAVKRLKGAGFEDKHAVTLVETLQDTQSTLATQDDLGRTEFAIHSDMEKMESRIRSDMEKMESRIRSDMESKFGDQRRFMLVFGSFTTGILGMLILLTK